MENDLTVQNQDVAVREYEHRIAEFLPGAKDVPQSIRLAMAQVAIAHGLDPFLKEVWPIPQKNRDKQIVGWDLMIGIAGWRAAAWRSNEYWGRRFEKCTTEERQWLGAQPNDIALRCIVLRRRTGQQPMEFDGYGLFRVGQEYSKMNALQCARYRAERDAMKAAFPISLPAGVSAKVADEETGEVINGSHDEGPKWDVITTDKREESLARVEARRQELCGDDDTLDELTKSAERDAVTNDPTAPPEPQAPSAPKPEPKERKSYRMARPVFDNDMNPEKWHIKANAFCSVYPNWQKDGKPDLNHVLASAGHAGYETITAANIDEVFAAIVAAHEAQAKP